jgi:WD40 repeat protein
MAYNETAGILAVGCEQGTIRLWPKDQLLGIRRGPSGGQPEVLRGHAGPVTALAWAGGVLASAGADQKIILWSLADQRPAHTLTSVGVVRALALTPDGKLLASGGDDPVVHLWDPATGKPVAKLEAHTDWVLALAFSADGTRLASGGYDSKVRIWDVPSKKKLLDISVAPAATPNPSPTPPTAVMALAFSPDDLLLAIGGNDAKIHVVNPADGRLGRILTGHGSSVTAVAFHPTGAVLASAGRDNTIRLWTATGQALKSLEGHTNWVQGLLFLAHGTHVASVGADQTLRIWDLAPGK